MVWLLPSKRHDRDSQDVVLTESEWEGRWNGSLSWEDCDFRRSSAWEMATGVSERLERRQPRGEKADDCSLKDS